ncbi:MAG: tRNA pseudouridine(38-40) synthase TruA [Campylobacterota bacterium]|nr:tRNA pseudouridine(38-40) synthase TruA [Campylobacterota bacterium]
MKIKITIAYDGSHYMGSQIQNSTPQTVMGTFQRVLNTLGIQDTAIASGRTDRDVHATKQVLHVKLPEYWSNLDKLKAMLNHQLPDSLHVRDITKVDDDFHARYSAKTRSYRYLLSDQEPNPFEAKYVSFVKDLDFECIEKTIQTFEGEYDFKYFMKSGSDIQSSVRTIYKCMAYQHHGKTVLYFEGNGFLRSQIRMMVGFLLGISEGKLNEEELKEQLTCKAIHSRKLAPPQGLYLAKIRY